MPKNWSKFTFNELLNIWCDHKKPDNHDPFSVRLMQHKREPLTHEEIEELVDYLLIEWSEIKQKVNLE